MIKRIAMNTKPSIRLAVRRSLFLLLAAIALAPLASLAQTQYMSYQGYLTDGSGNALGNTNTGPKAYDVVFRIWDLSTGGTIGGADDLFAELQTVTVDNGYFSVLLGQGTSYQSEPHGALANVFTSVSTPRYVEMTVLGIAANGASVTILPRLQLVAAPYSLLAVNAINVTGTNVVTAANIATNLGLWQSAGTNIYYHNGYVGLNGSTSPTFPLSFGSTLGDKISLYGTSSAYYGFGLIGSLLEVHADTSSSDIAFGTGGTTAFSEVMRVKGSGNVGIGTSSPGARLEVNGSFTSDGVATFNSSSVFNGVANFANSVGIGTGSPGAPFEVLTGNDVASIISSSSTIGTWLDLQNTASGTNWDIISTGSGNGQGAGKLLFASASSPGTTSVLPLTLTPSGSVGINTSFPGETLEVNGTASVDSWLNVDGELYQYGQAYFGNYVGIGTYSPGVPLEVDNGYTYDLGGNFYYAFDNTYGIAGSGSHDNTISIRASDGILSELGLYVTSDRRIKKNFVRSNAKDDLDKLNQLQVTDFNYIDTAHYGNTHKKGLIAQEVEKIVPDDITTQTGVVPDIYKGATYKDGWINLATDLKAGDRVKLISGNACKVCDVLEATPDKFRANFEPENDKVFVYGREVKDFRSVDYNSVAVLNISATQELSRRLDSLEKREARLAVLEQKAARVDALEQEVAELKKAVAQLARGGAGEHIASQPVRLEGATAQAQASLIPVGLER